jgi:hypothetical protein
MYVCLLVKRQLLTEMLLTLNTFSKIEDDVDDAEEAANNGDEIDGKYYSN